MDSLMAFQKLLILDRDLGTDLQPARLTGPTTVAGLSRHMVALMRGTRTPGTNIDTRSGS